MAENRIGGLVAAVHTPFCADGSLKPEAVAQQAAHLEKSGVAAVFIGGTTGECHSLCTVERLELGERWKDAADGRLEVVVHAGSNCLEDSRRIAAHAESCRARAIAAFAPSYFKPRSLDALVDWCTRIAEAAPFTPFYYYDIPSLTGVSFPMPAFLEKASKSIPTLAGLKYSNPDLAAFQGCLRAEGGSFEVLWGIDEYLLAAMVLGGCGAVGSTYNFAAPIYHRMISAFGKGDMETARGEQWRSAALVALLDGYGYMSASRAVMEMLGVEIGPPRPPFARLPQEGIDRLRADLERMGFFDWVSTSG
jgi:N-acetylneuraminate lyase